MAYNKLDPVTDLDRQSAQRETFRKDDATGEYAQAVVVVDGGTGSGPTSDATAANQATQITEAQTTNTKLDEIKTKQDAQTAELQNVVSGLIDKSTATNQATQIQESQSTNTKLDEIKTLLTNQIEFDIQPFLADDGTTLVLRRESVNETTGVPTVSWTNLDGSTATTPTSPTPIGDAATEVVLQNILTELQNKADLSETQPVSDTLAAKEAKQDIIIGHLDEVESKLDTLENDKATATKQDAQTTELQNIVGELSNHATDANQTSIIAELQDVEAAVFTLSPKLDLTNVELQNINNPTDPAAIVASGLYDDGVRTLPTSTQERYEFNKSGAVVATLVINYTDDTLETLSTWTWS